MTDPVYARSLHLAHFLAEYDADVENEAPLRQLAQEAATSARALTFFSEWEETDRHPLPRWIMVGISRTAEVLGLDRLRPAHGIVVPEWRDDVGALPDCTTVLLRWLRRCEPTAKRLLPLSASVFVPGARLSLMHDVQFDGVWDWECEGREQAQTRLRHEFEDVLQWTMDEAAGEGLQTGTVPFPVAVHFARDLRWLYWNVRHRLPSDDIKARSARELGVDIQASKDSQELINRAVWRMGKKVGVLTRRLG